MKNTVFIEVEGGTVGAVWAADDTNIIIVDHDVTDEDAEKELKAKIKELDRLRSKGKLAQVY
jgi:hypothetical protein